MSDLKSRKLMYLKAILFALIVACCAAMLLLENPSWKTAVLLSLTIWASARAYYFAFYVIEKYIDGEYKFSGLYSLTVYLLTQKHKKHP